MKIGDRVRVIGGIWVKKPSHDPIGIIVQVYSNKFETELLKEVKDFNQNVVRIRWDIPLGNYTHQNWYPNQLEVI